MAGLTLTAALGACGGGSGTDSQAAGGGGSPGSLQPFAKPEPAPITLADVKPGQWAQLRNTRIRSVLPGVVQSGSPSSIVAAWSGGTVDTARSRLLIWGGGHTDYRGNEMYALDLATLSINRITDPSPSTSSDACTSALPDGTPTSRHTYDGLTYLGHADKLFAVNGSMAPCGSGDPATWTFDFATNRWKLMLPEAPWTEPYGTMAVYDPVSELVYVKSSGGSFYSYSLESNVYTRLNKTDMPVDYHLTATIDSKRHKFVMVGDGVQVIDLATNTMSTVTTSNAPALVSARQSPGLAYDARADRIVAWQGGGNVYALDMDTGVWTQVATNPGPTAPSKEQGTFGRWGYIPQYGVFALVNDVDENAWVFRLAK